jgi:hypothetical protein
MCAPALVQSEILSAVFFFATRTTICDDSDYLFVEYEVHPDLYRVYTFNDDAELD